MKTREYDYEPCENMEWLEDEEGEWAQFFGARIFECGNSEEPIAYAAAIHDANKIIDALNAAERENAR